MLKITMLSLFFISSLAFGNSNEDLISYAKNGYEEDLSELLAHYDSTLNINYQDEEGNTALHYGSLTNNPKIIQLLMDSYPIGTGLKYNLKNKKEETPFYIAVDKCLQCISVLAKSKKINLEDGPITPLELAISNPAKDAVAAQLITMGANVDIIVNNTPEEVKRNLLFWLAGKRRPLSLNAYLKVKRDLNLRDAIKLTPLMLAASEGMLDNVKALVGNGASINLRDVKGNTALHHAAKSIGAKHLYDFEIFPNGFIDSSIYDFLINSDAKTNYTNLESKTAAQIIEADLESNEYFKKWLLESDSDKEWKDTGLGKGILIPDWSTKGTHYINLKSLKYTVNEKFNQIIFSVENNNQRLLYEVTRSFNSSEYLNENLKKLSDFINPLTTNY